MGERECGVWERESVEFGREVECGRERVWSVRESVECGRERVWERESVGERECGVWERERVWSVRERESGVWERVECGRESVECE